MIILNTTSMSHSSTGPADLKIGLLRPWNNWLNDYRFHQQGSHKEKPEKCHGEVVEMAKRVIEFCDQSWNFTDFTPEFYHVCFFFVDIKKLRNLDISLESPHFLTFSAICCQGKIWAEKWLWKIKKWSWGAGKLQSLLEPWSTVQIMLGNSWS